MRLQKYGISNFRIFIMILFLFVYFGCDEYQSESYQISGKDANACAQLQDTLFNEIATTDLTEFNPEWTDDNVPQNVPVILDSLKANGIVVSNGDLSTWVTTLEDADTNYVCLQTTLNSAVFYSDKIVTFKLMDSQGELRSASGITMPMETVGGCLTEEGDPQIRTRLEFSTPDEEYLLYIINQEQTFLGEDDEFIIILSIL
jgi:hypothetical protein